MGRIGRRGGKPLIQPVPPFPPIPPSYEQDLRIGDDRARRDLVRQAAVVHDRPRQHRGGHLDHRRGVVDPGAERVGEVGDPEPGRRRFVQHPAVSDHAQRRGVRQGARQPARLARRHARAPPLQLGADRRRHGRLREPRTRHLPRQVDRQHAGAGRVARVCQLLQLRRRTGAPDEPHRGGKQPARGGRRLADRRSLVRG